MNKVISKSKYITGLQCPKLLWFHYNDPTALPPPDPGKQAIFDTGHRVGDLAKRLYPDGVEVPWSRDLEETCTRTRELLRRRVPVFEASFAVDGCYCRADILVPAPGDAWDLIEVKSTTGVKDVHLEDVAFQAHVLEGAGVELDRLQLMHLDSTYVRQGDLDPAGLFTAEDVTAEARRRQPHVAARMAAMQRVIAGPCPDTPIGPHCTEPYDCDLWGRCVAFLPAHAVTELYRAGKETVFDMIARGVTAIADVPPDELSRVQRIQQQAVTTGRPHVEPDRIRAWLDGLAYPLYCLDFEAMAPAVPLFDGTRPYQHVPFQFSLHVLEHEGATPRHVEFLADTPGDPRLALIEALRAIGPDGAILAYNKGYEQRILRELAAAFPAHASYLESLIDRFRDLMTPFASFWYHHPRQDGSCSLKKVLPVLTDTSYADLEIADGQAAAREYLRVMYGEVADGERARILAALRTYCRQDTQALVDLLAALRSLV